jgi:DNA-binding MarR family transcriptional regulator
MNSEPSPLQDHLGYWLRMLSNHVSGAFAGRLEKHDVSVPQWVVLRVLFDHDALPLKDIVARVGVDQGALSRMVERLVVRGLVARVQNPQHRREVAISLTKEARRLVPKLAREADENDRAFFGQLPERKRQEFFGLIKTLLALNPNESAGMPID